LIFQKKFLLELSDLDSPLLVDILQYSHRDFFVHTKNNQSIEIVFSFSVLNLVNNVKALSPHVGVKSRCHVTCSQILVVPCLIEHDNRYSLATVEIKVKLKVGELKQSEYKPQDKKNEFERVMAKRRYSLFSIFIDSIEERNFLKSPIFTSC
jgi:hypothetical protein